MHELIGNAGNFISFFICMPQLWKIYKSKRIDGISWGTVWMLWLANVLHLLYVIPTKDYILIMKPSYGILVVGIQLVMMFTYRGVVTR